MGNTAEDVKVIDKLQEAAFNFFVRGDQGILWPYVYGAPQDTGDPVRGGLLYNEVLENDSDYYLYHLEAALFQQKGEQLASLIGPGATFIELGPGSEQSLRLKTVPLLQFCKDLRGYIGIDISQSFLDKGLAVIKSEFPDILIDGIQQDFTQLKELPTFEKSVVFFKGSTISNMTRDEVPSFINGIGQFAHPDHLLLIVHDANQDEVSLMKAYDTPRVALFIKNIMYRMARDSGAIGLNPESFRYKPQWDVANHDFKHVLIATEDQKFSLQDHTVTITKGEAFHVFSSFKYPIDTFQNIIYSAGYRPRDVILDDSGRMVAHLFTQFNSHS